MFAQVLTVSRTICALLALCVGNGLWNSYSVRAQQPMTSAAGTLKCEFSGGVSFIFGSTRSLECVFNTADGSRAEFYKGNITKFGVDIGFLQSGVILWSVLAPVTSAGRGTLAGTYVGVSAEVATGVGVGANALVGTNNIMLNPISISGVQGLNIAAGIASFELKLVSQPFIREPLPIEPGNQ